MLKASEVIKHIEKLYRIELKDYQKEFVKHVIRGDVIYTPRGFGRSMIYNGYADYLKNVVGKTTDYSVNPADFDKIYTYKDVSADLLSKEKMKRFKKENPRMFAREYKCKY